MIDHFMNHFVEDALSIVFGIFIINMVCESFLDFSPVEIVRDFIAKITGKKDEDR